MQNLVEWEVVDKQFAGEEALAMICVYCGGIAVAINLDPKDVMTNGQVMNSHITAHFKARHHKRPYPFNFFREHVHLDRQTPTSTSIC